MVFYFLFIIIIFLFINKQKKGSIGIHFVGDTQFYGN